MSPASEHGDTASPPPNPDYDGSSYRSQLVFPSESSGESKGGVSYAPAAEIGGRRLLSSRKLTAGAHARISDGFVFVARRVFLQLAQDFLHAESTAVTDLWR